MAVPMLDLSKQHAALAGELCRVFEAVLKSGRFVLGDQVESFERELAEACAADVAVGVSSGTDALLLSMMALGVQPGDEVITSPFTFFATAGCVARLGARAVFVDIDPQTYHIDADQIAAAITPRTRGVIPVHLFGQCADMGAITRVASDHSLWVIEDAAQAIGARDALGSAGTLGHAGCLSFYPTKNLSALGDAGACLTQDAELAQRMKRLRTHGDVGRYEHAAIGGNFRLDALQAAMLRVKLPHLRAWNQQRRECAARYHAALRDLPLALPVARSVAHPGEGSREEPRRESGENPGEGLGGHVYHQYTVRVRGGQRDALRDHLRAAGIGCEVYYPIPLHLQACFGSWGHQRGDFPHAEQAAQEVLSLPVYPGLSAEDQQAVVDAIRRFYATGQS